MIINTENTKAQMRKGILEFCILLIIARGKAYTMNIIKDLKKSGLIVVEGTIYPLLTRLKNSGLLDYSWQESQSGPPRKYYELTEKGNETLKELAQNWEELTKSVLVLNKKYLNKK
ncbi:MAG: transcriptional regulator, PadR-like protein family [Candidatus Falkowbacteria bacterium GW2011_GWC2_38_22]|uniref:Transcriptional regulator, PadR-like protein family n=1 Tax=Candidatus Falkowbacteria bacterium GW2011_GWE1_38_31 TaxID=1618638 RepID=A0A0G0JW95_9BACT|nr:MAG: transcriptional regulator, PadR-like protein family [Candidatus Falkowbacteria bacterium GW2011_GWF2_38_1205]KKQ62072.1 MAG: transcriptional regulator, PadR-like protein family [Candidatus Falkowbacteria bacterium GW2011_GWC2_38_22]KKQ64222.1 MAG: transcriptional regulator, PadR-like protein family [Candidatus Falkowbacteria bacterium GW2011_GWF1_38_22]KKQ66199.1 MAG: transcriptional regulator, PadR-like protein family [Candidatus Falkowbacteria bacterium GW2011_GWE2_38_254]KKQ70927.1 M